MSARRQRALVFAVAFEIGVLRGELFEFAPNLRVKALQVGDGVFVIRARNPRAHAVAIHQQQAVVVFQRHVLSAFIAAGQRLAHGAANAFGFGLVQSLFIGQIKQGGQLACVFQRLRAGCCMAFDQAARQGHAVKLAGILLLQLVQPAGGQPAFLQPLIQLMRQRHCVRGNDEAIHLFFSAQRLADFFGKQRGPQALDGGQGAQVFAFLGPGGLVLGDAGPQGVSALAGGHMQVFGVGCQPFGFAGQGAAPACLRALLKGPQRFGGSQHALGQILHCRIKRARIGGEEGEGAALLARDLQLFLQQLPGGRVQKAARLPRLCAKEGAHGFGERAHVQIGLLLRVARADEREGHSRPVHFRIALQLLAHLLVAVQVFAFQSGCIQQAAQRFLPQLLQPLAHFFLHGLGDVTRLGGRHNGNKAVGQGSGKQRVAVGLAALPVAVFEQRIRQAAFIAQPEIDLRHTAQARKQNGIRPQPLAHHAHGLPRQARQQVRAGPQVFHLAGGGNKGLHRADGQRQQRRLALRIGRKSARKGRNQIQVIPDGVIGNARVGWQQLPQLAQLAVIGLFAQLRAKAPEREQSLAPAVRLLVHRPQRFQQSLHMPEAALADVFEIGIRQAAMLFHVKHRAGKRMNQLRIAGPLHTRPRGVGVGLARRRGDLLHRPLGPVSGGGPPVGALHMAVNGLRNAFAKQVMRGCAIAHRRAVGAEGI